MIFLNPFFFFLLPALCSHAESKIECPTLFSLALERNDFLSCFKQIPDYQIVCNGWRMLIIHTLLYLLVLNITLPLNWIKHHQQWKEYPLCYIYKCGKTDLSLKVNIDTISWQRMIWLLLQNTWSGNKTALLRTNNSTPPS